MSQAIIETAYHRLLFTLDSRIRSEHQKVHKTLFDIKFSLAEISALIADNSAFEKKEIYECRKFFYDLYIERIKNENLEPSRINLIESTIIRDINALDDESFLKLLQRMNLNETKEKLKSPAHYYNKVGLTQVFFRMLIDIIDTDPVLLEETVKYAKVGESSKFVLTAIMEEERDKLEVIASILTNLESQNLLWENHLLVNKNIDAELIDRSPSINSIASRSEQEDDNSKFMFFGKSKLIKIEDAKQKLNNGGTN